MEKALRFSPVMATPEVMLELEARGLLRRLCPGRDEPSAAPGETGWSLMYQSRACYGPHRLIAVTANSCAFERFGSHPDSEEFLVIGDPAARPLRLLFSLHQKAEMEALAAAGGLLEKDFILLEIPPNDPWVSFFTVLPGVPHGEATVNGTGKAPSFYVTESCGLPTEFAELGEYTLHQRFFTET